VLKTSILICLLLLSGCTQYYLQNLSVVTNRIDPAITTSVESPSRFEMSLSGNYSKKNRAEYMEGSRSDFTADNKIIEPGCKGNPLCSLKLKGDNVHLKFPEWSVNFQFSGVPFYKKTYRTEHVIRVHSDAQSGKYDNSWYYTYKVGPVYSYILRDFGVHPKIFGGVSKVNSFYDAISSTSILSSQYTERIGQETSYKLFCQGGVTLEYIAHKKLSFFLDVSGAYQWLYTYNSFDYVGFSYMEFTGGIRFSTGIVSYLAGASLSLSNQMGADYPARSFFRIQTDFGKKLN